MSENMTTNVGPYRVDVPYIKSESGAIYAGIDEESAKLWCRNLNAAYLAGAATGDAELLVERDASREEAARMRYQNAELRAECERLRGACDSAIQIIEQLIPEPSARGVADVVLFDLRASLAGDAGQGGKS